jgi:putative dimethyl sulfoxide reductase chaperone
VFGLVIPKECPPYETEYHPSSQAFQRAQQMADIAGFYHAFGIEPSGANLGRPDHITLEFEFMAFVLMKQRLANLDVADGEPSEQVLVCESAARSFVKDHLAWWVPAFATGLLRKSGEGYYHALARTLAAFIPAERYRLNLPAPFNPAMPELIEYPEEESGCASCALRT